jgi:hypothetical protein
VFDGIKKRYPLQAPVDETVQVRERGVDLPAHGALTRGKGCGKPGEKRLFQGLKGRPPRFYIPCYSLDWVEAVNSSPPRHSGRKIGLQR